MKIAWIGTGVMGKAMLLQMHEAKHSLKVYNRSIEKALDLQVQGIQVCTSIEECVSDVDVVFTMVGFPKDVEEIYRTSIFPHCKKGCLLIDMTTSSPSLAKQLAQEAHNFSFEMLDAPVSGGDSGAKEASLTIMVGGKKSTYEKAVPLFSLLGKHINYMGQAGNGQHCKACNQIAVAGAISAVSEALVYAQNVGLNEIDMLDAVSCGAGGSWQMDHTAPRILNQDFAPGFYIKHFIKDMRIVKEEMKAHNIDLKMLESVCSMYEQLAEDKEENNGTQALIHYYTNKNK